MKAIWISTSVFAVVFAISSQAHALWDGDKEALMELVDTAIDAAHHNLKASRIDSPTIDVGEVALKELKKSIARSGPVLTTPRLRKVIIDGVQPVFAIRDNFDAKRLERAILLGQLVKYGFSNAYSGRGPIGKTGREFYARLGVPVGLAAHKYAVSILEKTQTLQDEREKELAYWMLNVAEENHVYTAALAKLELFQKGKGLPKAVHIALRSNDISNRYLSASLVQIDYTCSAHYSHYPYRLGNLDSDVKFVVSRDYEKHPFRPAPNLCRKAIVESRKLTREYNAKRTAQRQREELAETAKNVMLFAVIVGVIGTLAENTPSPNVNSTPGFDPCAGSNGFGVSSALVGCSPYSR